MYLTPYTGESHMPLHFRGKFLLLHEHIQYCFAYLNSAVSLKPCLIEKFGMHVISAENDY